MQIHPLLLTKSYKIWTIITRQVQRTFKREEQPKENVPRGCNILLKRGTTNEDLLEYNKRSPHYTKVGA